MARRMKNKKETTVNSHKVEKYERNGYGIDIHGKNQNKYIKTIYSQFIIRNNEEKKTRCRQGGNRISGEKRQEYGARSMIC